MAEHTKHRAQSGQGKSDTPAFVPGTTEVRTNDPGITQPVVSPPPERAVAFQTSGTPGSPAGYPFVGSGGVVQCADKNGGEQNRQKQNSTQQQPEGGKKKGEEKGPEDEQRSEQGKKSEEDGHKKEGKHRDKGEHSKNRHRHPHHRDKKKELSRNMPRWPTLLITCVLALVCGAGGAWGYSALFGSGQADHGQSGKGGKSGGESDSDQESTTVELKKELHQLADNMDELGTRIDRLNQTAQEARMPVPQYYPGSSRIERMAPAGDDGSAPIPTALQTQLTVLAHKVEQMEDLPGRVQELERRATELQEAIKILVETRAASGSTGQ